MSDQFSADSLPETPAQTEAPLSSKRKDEPVVNLSGNVLNYLAVALTFLVMGVLIGMALPSNKLTKEDVAVVVRDVLADTNLGAPQVVDRFELVDDDPYLGDEDAPIVIVEFGDFACRYCEQYFTNTLNPLLENYGEHIRFVYRDYAILTPESFPSALAAHCAQDQAKFWEFHDMLYANQDQLGRDFYFATAEKLDMDIETFTQCFDDGKYIGEVNDDYIAGLINGVEGTPAFFVNGKFVRGAMPYAYFEGLIKIELEKAGIELEKAS